MAPELIFPEEELAVTTPRQLAKGKFNQVFGLSFVRRFCLGEGVGSWRSLWTYFPAF